MREIDRGFYQQCFSGVFTERLDEGFIHFELVGADALQVGQRGQARAVIIDGYLDAGGGVAFDAPKRGFRLRHRGGLCGEEDSGLDVYVSATKIVLDRSLVLNVTVRATDANQFGLLGFGGDQQSGRTAQVELSGAYMLNDRLLIGAEYRTRPDNLGFASEDDGYDVFAAYAVTDNLTLVAGHVALGSIATFDDQDGAYLSLQVGF